MRVTMIAAALALMSMPAFAADIPIDVEPTPSGVDIPIYEGPQPIPVYGQHFYGGYGYGPYYRPYPYYYRPRPFIRFGPFGFGFGHHRHWRGGYGHRW